MQCFNSDPFQETLQHLLHIVDFFKDLHVILNFAHYQLVALIIHQNLLWITLQLNFIQLSFSYLS